MRLSALFILFLLSSFILSQNFIKNGDFEIRTKFNSIILNPYSNLDKVKFWDNPNRTSPDIHKNGKYDSFLKLGQSKAYSGEYYLGMINEASGFRSEYVEVKLLKKLKKDSLYCIQVHTMADSKSSYFVSSHYVAFYHKYYHQHDDNYFFLPDTVGLRNPNGSLIVNTDEYVKLSNVYKAKGNESHFLLGPFGKNKFYYLNDSKNVLKNSHTITTYYFFDSLSLSPIRDSLECPCHRYTKPNKYEEVEQIKVGQLKGKKYILSNVKFAFKNGKLNLNPVSRDELIIVSDILKKDSLINLTIIAHVFETDVLKQNKKISEERARNLREYFISQKIDVARIEIIGNGSSFPLYDNDTKEHQEKNTRIELLFD